MDRAYVECRLPSFTRYLVTSKEPNVPNAVDDGQGDEGLDHLLPQLIQVLRYELRQLIRKEGEGPN